MVRKCVAELVELHKRDESDASRPREISAKLVAVSKFLPTPIKCLEFLKRLSAQLLKDRYMLELFEKVVDPAVSCSDCMQAVNQARIKKQANETCILSGNILTFFKQNII